MIGCWWNMQFFGGEAKCIMILATDISELIIFQKVKKSVTYYVVRYELSHVIVTYE